MYYNDIILLVILYWDCAWPRPYLITKQNQYKIKSTSRICCCFFCTDCTHLHG